MRTTSARRLLTAAALAVVTAATSATVVASSAAAADHEGLPSGNRTDKSLVIGIDGAMLDVIRTATTPNLTGLMQSGVTAKSSLYASPMAGTVSGPGWATIGHGVWPDKHKAVDNGFGGRDFATYPDYLTRLERADDAASTLVVGTWAPVPDTIFGPEVDLRVRGGNDVGTTAKAVDYLRNGNPDATFVHLDEVDGAGHSSGSASAAYRTAIQRADAQVGEILAAVRARATYAQEDWQVIVTADHGHTPTGGHGGNTPEERSTFVIASGGGLPAGQVRHDVRIVDVAPTVLAHEGVTIDPAWNLDGHPVGRAPVDAFDSLRPALRTQVDETRPGATTLGWTQQTPQGWSIDNSAMPTGGVTELRGWTFVTDEFWTNTERGQLRETSVRHRDVFAVADSDEWDDKSHAAGPFDSTLVSPAYPVSGTAKVTVSYATSYQVDGPQTGDVYAVWNGGTPQLVKSYRSAVNGVERLELTPPAGATSLQLRFRYTGTNSYFWTLDQVQVQQAGTRVAGITTTAVSVDEPGIAIPWKVTGKVAVAQAGGTGAPVAGATVSAELRFDDHATPVQAVTGADGVATLVAYAMYAETADLVVTGVAKDGLAYQSGANAVSQVTVQRPLTR